MTTCPRCYSEAVRRSRSRTWWEIVRKTMTRQRPYRCDRCDWRGWRPLDPVHDAGLGTDVSLPESRDPERTFTSPRDRSRQVDLHLLDAPEASETPENLKSEV